MQFPDADAACRLELRPLCRSFRQREILRRRRQLELRPFQRTGQRARELPRADLQRREPSPPARGVPDAGDLHPLENLAGIEIGHAGDVGLSLRRRQLELLDGEAMAGLPLDAQ